MKTQGFSSIKVTFLALLSLALLAGWVFLSYKSHTYKKELATIEAEALNKSSENSYLISVRNTLRDVKDQIEAIDGRFIDKDSVPQYITMLENVSNDTGVKVDLGSINVDTKTLNIDISGSGTWEKVMGFVAAIESLPYALRIENLGLQKTESTVVAAGGATWNFSFTIVQHISPPKADK